MITDNLWAVLSTAILNGVSPKTREALNIITEEMISDRYTLDVYRAVKSLDDFGSTVSMMSVSEITKNKIDIGDLSQTIKSCGTTSDPIYKANQVASMHNDKLVAMELQNILGQLGSGMPFDRNQVSQALQNASQTIAPVTQSKPKSFSEFAEGYIDIIEERQKNPQGSFLDIGLDVQIDKTALVVLGGQPGMGKTALALYCNRYVAQAGKKVLIFSLEMEGGQLFEREVAALTKIPTQRLKAVDYDENDLTQTQWGLLGNSLSELSKMEAYIDDDPNLSVPILQKKCRDFKEKHPDLALITIDYLTLMKLPDAASRALSVGEATRITKLLAKELKTPILLLSQLNREADKALREPRNSDLRDSGAIEQDADVIIFPYREEVHKPDTPNKGLAKIIKSKVRDGECGDHVLEFRNGAFYEAFTSWQEMPKEEPPMKRKF